MRLMTGKRYQYIALSAVVASSVALGCGGNGASNNDQGVSVTLLGFFGSTSLTIGNTGGGGGSVGSGSTAGQLGCGRLPVGVTGGYMRLGEAQPEPSNSVTSTNPNGVDPAGAYVSVIGIQNNMYGQMFRADRIVLEYYIPGASSQPPSTTVPATLLAGPAEAAQQFINQNIGGGNNNGQDGNNQGLTSVTGDPGIRQPGYTSLPPSLANICNRVLAQVTVLPSSVREWMNFNRDSLPEAPFKMELIVRVSGLSSSGNRYETNDAVFDLDVLPETFVEPTVDQGLATPTPTTDGATETSPGTLDDSSGVEQLEGGLNIKD